MSGKRDVQVVLAVRLGSLGHTHGPSRRRTVDLTSQPERGQRIWVSCVRCVKLSNALTGDCSIMGKIAIRKSSIARHRMPAVLPLIKISRLRPSEDELGREFVEHFALREAIKLDRN